MTDTLIGPEGPIELGGGAGPLTDSGWIETPHAQILTLPTTPVDILAAPGAGKLILPILTILKATTVTPYANVATDPADGQIRLYYGDVDFASLPVASGGGFNLANVFEDGNLTMFGPIHVPDATSKLPYGEMWFGAFPVTNEPLTLTVQNTGGDFTGGDPANKLWTRVIYAEWTLPA